MRWWPTWLLFASLLFLFDWGMASMSACVGSEQEQARQCAETYYGLTNSFSARGFFWLLDLIRGNPEFLIAATTIVTAVLAFTLWRSTHKMWMASCEQIAVAQATATAMMDAERPFVLVNKLKATGFTSRPDNFGRIVLSVDIEFKNAGKSPAILNGWTLAIAIHTDWVPQPQYGRLQTLRSIIDVGGTYDSARPSNFLLDASSIARIWTEGADLIVYTVIEYTDIFRRPHRSREAFRMIFEGENETAQHRPDGPDAYWEHS